MQASQKILITLLGLLIIVGGYYLFTTPKKVPASISETSSSTDPAANVQIKKYIGSDFSFQYPAALQALQNNATVTLTHSVPYKHTNPCDFKGDGPKLDALTDFSMTIKVVPQSVKDYLQSSGWPDWNYVSQNPFTLGAWSGYHIAPGAEGCGEDLYYLTVSPNQTVVITHPFVAEFAEINGNHQKYLGLPGVIAPTTSEAYFSQILASLKINK